MDKDTRNRIQRATQDARALLEREYAEQLEGVFDIRLDGTIAKEPGSHLDAKQRVLRAKLVAAVEHVRAGGLKADEAVAAYLREAAFTTLNRFVAIKMLEARGLVQECISRGDQSSGFKEFTGLAPGLVQLPDHGYRLYIESIFDEIGREVRVLFARRDPASLLWPRRQALQDLLAVLNAAEVAGVWDHDETIGWVYQYFNSDDERKQMRAESQAPRNSRELAVRNQFFTPRYVVQFLTDNTLGRIWYEMRQGETRLGDLDYLVRRPNEVFLAEGQEPSAAADASDENLTQEELLQRPVHVPFRAKKDPRDIRVLDPACGSGHFLLYAFDLLLTIYEEAWADEASPPSDRTGRSLKDDYPEIEGLRTAGPGLVLRHNLHGIDIDARCAQIAALALWMRAQRAYKKMGIARDARPVIQKTNIVVAEPMPGDPELRREFLATLESKLGSLVECVFDRMELAGEGGSLLRIEDDIRDAVRDILGEHGELFRATDEDRWREAEKTVIAALRSYTQHTANGRAYQRRLFAEDAARGLGFIDACRQEYDVVVMNPPFGSPSAQGKSYIDGHYEKWRHDVGPCFVSRFCDRLVDRGILGTLTPRTYFSLTRLAKWRGAHLIGNVSVSTLADLGFKVLDEAMVEVAAYCCMKGAHDEIAAFDCLSAQQEVKDDALVELISLFRDGTVPVGIYLASIEDLRRVPQSRFIYWAPHNLIRVFRTHDQLDNGDTRVVREGLHTGDNDRSLRLWWEVDSDEERWIPFPKGGEYCAFYSDVDLVLDWKHSGRDILAGSAGSHGVVPSRDFYFKPGITYTRRTASGISFRVLPKGAIFSSTGPIICAEDETEGLALLSYLSSRVLRTLVEYLVGGGDSAVSRGAARDFMTGVVSVLPLPAWADSVKKIMAESAVECWRQMKHQYSYDETDRAFNPEWRGLASIRELAAGESRNRVEEAVRVLEETWRVEKELSRLFRLKKEDLFAIAGAVGEHPASLNKTSCDDNLAADLAMKPDDELIDNVSSFHQARDATKQFHFAHRRLELVARALGVHPRRLAPWFGTPRPSDVEAAAWTAMSWLMGRCFGRWHNATEGSRRAPPTSPFEKIRDPSLVAPPGSSSFHSVLVDDEGHRDDLVAELGRMAVDTWEDAGERLFSEVIELLQGQGGSARQFIRRSSFSKHLLHYSKSRRRAPIYWQLATPSASYSVWLYYHGFTNDTFYKVLNDYAGPKLQHEEHKLAGLVQSASGNPTASQRKEIAEQENFVEELRAFREEVARIAPLWNPDLNDGVIINFAPLWRLVPQHRAWQKECKNCWDKLVKGEYDWAHLAMHLWPERVVPKCAEDRSLAIPHGLEDEFWYEDGDGKWQPRKVDQATVDKLVKERTSAAVKDALQKLLEAPAPSAARGSGRTNSTRSALRRTRASRSKTTNGATEARSRTAASSEVLDKVKDAIARNGDGASKAEVLEATGISAGQWNTAIKGLLAHGAVTQTGKRHSARYYLAEAGGES